MQTISFSVPNGTDDPKRSTPIDDFGSEDGDDDLVSRADTLYSNTTMTTSYLGSSSKGGSSSGLEPRDQYVDPVVAEKEQKAVFWARMTLIVVLLIALSSVATAMYMVVTNAEKEEFQSQVSLDVTSILPATPSHEKERKRRTWHH